ncbi:hypothetical protein M433DRAFT_3510 [Acidomyces richmondensis BFW]|nr:MAG: hypothetical protein FE78DRAFT_29487 [Acidomyces sp. 'richmondensis']KYG46673.1 hypothetical protein M433DRAFT_3510 [Acidomyces richmondensis BFW]
MDNSLERVSTVYQRSMGSTRLPLELQQLIYSFLDAESFHAARNVCKWWRYASVDTITLARQLKKLPILPSPDASTASPLELHHLFAEASYILMLGVRIERESVIALNPPALQLGGPKVIATTNGQWTVTLNNRQIALFDTTSKEPRLLCQRPLNDLRETIGNGPWLKVGPTTYLEMALSSDGRLLAIAQERVVQIYDLAAPADSFTVNENIALAAGCYICGIDFEQHGHVLRVRLSSKGTVLYLGTPPSMAESRATANLEHWKSRRGLKHVFLDSSVLVPPARVQDGHASRLSGLQLIRPFYDGFLFAAQHHGGDESSHYILGHVRCSTPHNPEALTAEPQGVTILAKLQSFLSAWNYTLNGSNEGGRGLWENMPSAHEHHPCFALSPDSRMLILGECDKKRVRPHPLTQIFAYRLPPEGTWLQTLKEQERLRTGNWATRASWLAKLETGQDDSCHRQRPEKKHAIGRIPLCISTVQGAVLDMTFDVVTDKNA